MSEEKKKWNSRLISWKKRPAAGLVDKLITPKGVPEQRP